MRLDTEDDQHSLLRMGVVRRKTRGLAKIVSTLKPWLTFVERNGIAEMYCFRNGIFHYILMRIFLLGLMNEIS
jgi:hypothetical protein